MTEGAVTFAAALEGRLAQCWDVPPSKRSEGAYLPFLPKQRLKSVPFPLLYFQGRAMWLRIDSGKTWHCITPPPHITQAWIQQHLTLRHPVPRAGCIPSFLGSTQERVSPGRGVRTSDSPQPSAGLRLLAPQERRSQDSGFPSPIPSAKKQPTSDSLAIAGINEAVIWAGTRGITAEQIKTELELRTAEVFILCIPSKNKPNLLTQVD